MKRIRRIMCFCMAGCILLSGCSRQTEQTEAWKSMRYYFQCMGSDENLESIMHPQLKKELTGAFCYCELVLPDDAQKEDIAKLTMAVSQSYLNSYFEGNEEVRKRTLGVTLNIYQYGELIAEDVILLLDKDGKYLEIFQPDEAGGTTGKFITLEEFADSIKGEGVK